MQTALVSVTDWIIVVPVLLPLLAAALLLILQGRFVSPSILTGLAVLGVGVGDLFLLRRVLPGQPLAMTMGRWLPPFGISFVADALGAAFALAAAVVTLSVLVYGRSEPPAARAGWAFYALVLVLLSGVDGAFLTGDLFNLYVWFEVMLIASFGLLVFSATPIALDGALKYGLLNFLATSLFLLALGLLYGTLGTLNMADVIARAGGTNTAVLTAIAALLLVAFGTKAAALPLNAWLPASYHTPPAAVSALLGGILTKVGVYALLRTLVLLLPANRDLLEPLLAVVAGATLVLAPLGAIAEGNLRRAVGYLLIGGIGAAVVGLCVPNPDGIGGAVAYPIHAMLTISALYLAAGLIEDAAGGPEVNRMGGLYAVNAPLSVLFLVLTFAIAGVPPFLGFWPKLMLLQGAAALGTPWAFALAVCLLLNALLTLLAGGRLWARIFWRPADSEIENRSNAPPNRRALAFGSACGLAGLVLVLGLWPEPLLLTARAAAAGLLAPDAYVSAVGMGGRR